jgi:2'-5' RNA ligase
MRAPEKERGHRLFLGVFPPPEWSAALAEALAGSREPAPGLSWVEAGRWHVTLAYLGETQPDRIPGLSKDLSELAGAWGPFRADLNGVGAFPSAEGPELLFAGVEDPTGAWRSIAGSLRLVLSQGGFPVEERPYRPHLTLGRAKDPSVGGTALSLLEEKAGSLRMGWAVEGFQLARSWLGNGPRYEVLEHFNFGKA